MGLLARSFEFIVFVSSKRGINVKKLCSWTLGVVVAGLTALATPAYAASNLVTNGGFEAGTFSGWTETGETVFNGVQCAGAGNATVYEGNCSAYFGPFVSTGGISQSIGFGSAGTPWDLTFGLQSDGGAPSSFSVQFGGQTLLSLSNLPAGGYTLYHFTGTAASKDLTLAFNFFSPSSYMSLDAVTVAAVPEPATMTLMGAGLVALVLARRRKASASDAR